MLFKGLNDGLQLQLMTVVYADYQTLVERANVIENKRREMKEKKRKFDVQRQLRNTHEPCLSPPTITLMKTNTSTSEEDYDCGEIERYENDCFEKFVENNQNLNNNKS